MQEFYTGAIPQARGEAFGGKARDANNDQKNWPLPA